MIDYKRRHEAFAEFKTDIEQRLDAWMKEHVEHVEQPLLLSASKLLKPVVTRFSFGVTMSPLPGLTQRLMDATTPTSDIILVLPAENGEWFVYARGEIRKRFTGPDAHAEASAFASKIAAELSDQP